MPSRTLGIIGYGGFGRFLHHAWSGMDAVDVVAVADADAQRDPGGVTFFTDWRDLVRDPRLDIVSIATPPASHVTIACAAMDAGKHVLIEKPLATSREGAERVLQVRDRTRRVASVDYVLRFNPIVEAIHAWCRSGCFGKLQRVGVENYAQDEALPPAHWFWDPAVSGGILVEHAVHFIDLIHACTSARVVASEGIAPHRHAGQEDRVLLTVVYEDGLVATQYHAFNRPDLFERTSLRFVFDLVQLDVDGWIPLGGRVLALVHDATEAELARLPGFQVVRREAIGAAGGGASPLHSGGRPYPVSAVVEGAFALPEAKPDAYAGALRALLADFMRAIEDSRHALRVTLEDARASLNIALDATRQARRE